MYIECQKPATMYGCEIWKWTKSNKNDVQRSADNVINKAKVCLISAEWEENPVKK